MSSKRHKEKGFTLIELLMVIAIIGLLSAIVLGALNQGRDKAKDARIKQDLNSVRSLAELYYSHFNSYRRVTGGDYSGNCLTSTAMFADSGATGAAKSAADQIAAAIADAWGQNGNIAYSTGQNTGKLCRVSGDGQRWMVSVRFKGNDNHWCVDSAGRAEEIETIPSASVIACM